MIITTAQRETIDRDIADFCIGRDRDIRIRDISVRIAESPIGDGFVSLNLAHPGTAQHEYRDYSLLAETIKPDGRIVGEDD